MANFGPSKTWTDGEILSHTDLNAALLDIINNVTNNNIDADNIDETDDYTWSGANSFTGGHSITVLSNAAASIVTGTTLEWDPGDGGQMTDNSSGISLDFKLPDAADNQDTFASIAAICLDDTSTSEDGELSFRVATAGTNTEQMTLSSTALTVTPAITASGGITGSVTSSNATITGGTITGITDIAIADGGTGASTAAAARTNLGLEIGVDVQAYDAELQALSGLTPTDSNIIVGNGSTFVTESGATARTSLGLGSIATQDASAVSITGGSLTGMTSYSGGTISGTTGTFSGDVAVGTDKLYVDVSASRVGINTSSPQAPLNAVSAYSSGTTTTSLKLATVGGYDSGSGTSIDFGQDQSNYSTWLTGKIASPRTGTNWGGSLVFYTNDNSAATGIVERLRLNHDGKLLINRTSGNSALSIDPVSTGDPNIQLYNKTNDAYTYLKNDGSAFVIQNSYGTTAGYKPIQFMANASVNLHIDEVNGSVGIGTSSASAPLHIIGSDGDPSASHSGDAQLILENNGTTFLEIATGATHYAGMTFSDGTATRGAVVYDHGTALGGGADSLHFQTAGSIRAVLDASGNLGIGTSSPSYPLEVAAGTGTTGLMVGGSAGQVELQGDGQVYGYQKLDVTSAGLQIKGFSDGGGAKTEQARLWLTQAATGASGGEIRFYTNNGSAVYERARITSTGSAIFNATSADGASVVISNSIASTYGLSIYDDANSGWIARFYNNSAVISGSITRSGTTVAYNTSSDYRLKQNVVGITDGITRIKSLKPSRFNFIAEADRTVDGFVAHEVSDIVPEAISGAKDAVDEEGNPEYQGIDQSKLVPLLTAALQEAITKIETLETKVAALEAA